MNLEISCDLGEAFTVEETLVEGALWPLVDAANVACGGHAGDRESMRAAVALAARHGVVLGAHPSFPDRAGFGRRRIEIEPSDLRVALARQVGELREIATSAGVLLRRIKPHGALYNEAHHDRELARIVVDAALAAAPRSALVAAPGSALLEEARRRGLDVVREAFADRRYRSDGSLVPRSAPGALLLDFAEAAGQGARLAATGTVLAEDGSEVQIEFDTLCVHGDMPDSVERVRAIRAALAGP